MNNTSSRNSTIIASVSYYLSAFQEAERAVLSSKKLPLRKPQGFNAINFPITMQLPKINPTLSWNMILSAVRSEIPTYADFMSEENLLDYYNDILKDRCPKRKRKSVHKLLITIEKDTEELDGCVWADARVIADSEDRFARILEPSSLGDCMYSMIQVKHVAVDEDEPLAAENNLALYKGVRIRNVFPYTEREKDLAEALKFQETLKGKRFRVFSQSSSGGRQITATYMMQKEKDFENQWRNAIKKVCGFFPTSELLASKFLAYTATGQSSTIHMVGNVDVTIMKDYVGENGVVYSDGEGIISLGLAEKWAKQLGLGYIPMAWQIRTGDLPGESDNKENEGIIIKGLSVVMGDLPEGVEMILTNSQVKIDGKARNISVDIAGYSRLSREGAYMNYMLIAGLAISAENLIRLGERTIQIALDAPKSAENAMIYLGMLGHSQNEDGSECDEIYGEDFRNKLMRTLDACPDSIHDSYIQGTLYKMIEKTIVDVAMGRVFVSGDYVYCVTEPQTIILRSKKLKKGQVWYRGFNGRKAVLFRNPQVSHRAPTVVDVVNDEEMELEFGHFRDQNIIVLNCEDYILYWGGGADCDGDRFLIVFDQIIIDSVLARKSETPEETKNPVASSKKTIMTYPIVVAHINSHMRPSLVGTATDISSTWIDCYWEEYWMTDRDEARLAMIEEKIFGLEAVHGRIIDSVKTDEAVGIPDELYLKLRPSWLRPNAKKTYESNSPMGQLNRWAKNKAEEIQKDMQRTKAVNMIFRMMEGVDTAKYMQVAPNVESIYNAYRRAIAIAIDSVKTMQLPKDVEKQYISERVGSIIEEFMPLMDTLTEVADAGTIAACAYNVAYAKNGGGKGVSFPWTCSFEGLIEVLSKSSDGRYMLVPVKTKLDEKPTELVVFNYAAFTQDNMYIGTAPVANGTYPTFYKKDMKTNENKMFLRVARTEEIKADIQSKGQQLLTFSTGGSKEKAERILALAGQVTHIGKVKLDNGAEYAGIFDELGYCGLTVRESTAKGFLCMGNVVVKKAELYKQGTYNSVLVVVEAI